MESETPLSVYYVSGREGSEEEGEGGGGGVRRRGSEEERRLEGVRV